MRLLEYFDILLERNVANIDGLKEWISSYVGRIQQQDKQKWFAKQALKYLIAEHPDASPMKPEELAGYFIQGVPPWAEQAARQGDLFFVDPTGSGTYFGFVVDWLNSLPAGETLNMNMKQAIEHANAWHTRFERSAGTGEDVEGEDIVGSMELPGGYRWVELISHKAMSRESDQMGHCVGGEICSTTNTREEETSYWPLVKAGKAKIFSLRDSNNEPHITLELGGKFNHAEVEDDTIRSMANKNGLDTEDENGVEINTSTLWDQLDNEYWGGSGEKEREFSKAYNQFIPTPEENGWGVNQIKGKQNEKPIAKYQPFLVAFLNRLGIPIFDDHANMAAPRVMDKDTHQYVDLYNFKPGQDVSWAGKLTLENMKGSFEFGHMQSGASHDTGRGGMRRMIRDSGSLQISGTDVRSIKSLNTGAFHIHDVPNLTLEGDIAVKGGVLGGNNIVFFDSNITFGPNSKGFDYNGMVIKNSTVLNMPGFMFTRDSSRSGIQIEDSTVEFPELMTNLQDPEHWYPLGDTLRVQGGKVRLPKKLSCGNYIALAHCETNLDEVNEIDMPRGELRLFGVEINKLPERLVVAKIITDQPEKIASLMHDGVELGDPNQYRNEGDPLYGGIYNTDATIGQNRGLAFKVIRQNGKNEVVSAEEHAERTRKRLSDDKGGLGHAPTTGAPQGIDARGYGSVDVMPYQEENRPEE